MTAFAFALFLSVAMSGAIYLWARRRKPGTPLSWGEAFLGGGFVFFYMLLIYGILPNAWLQWCNGPLKWRSDKLGIPAGPFNYIHVLFWHFHPLRPNHRYLGFIPYAKGAFWPNGITFFGRGKVNLTAQGVGDIVATVIYGVAVGVNAKGWLWWQRRDKAKAATPELTTSAYGRPLVRRV